MAKQNQFRQVQRSQQRPQSPPPAEVQPPSPAPEPAPLPEPIEVSARQITVEQTSSPNDRGSDNVFDILVDPKPHTVVFMCSDPKFQAAFRQFVEGKLGLRLGVDYIPVTIAGGGCGLGRPSVLPKDFKFVREQLELFREHYDSLRHVIVINHAGCAKYRKLCEKIAWLLGAFHIDLPRKDLKLISQVFADLLSHLKLQLTTYYAKRVDGDSTKTAIDRVS